MHLLPCPAACPWDGIVGRVAMDVGVRVIPWWCRRSRSGWGVAGKTQIRSDMGSKLLCAGGRWVGGVIGVISHCWIGLCRRCSYGLGLLLFFSNLEVRGWKWWTILWGGFRVGAAVVLDRVWVDGLLTLIWFGVIVGAVTLVEIRLGGDDNGLRMVMAVLDQCRGWSAWGCDLFV